MNISGSLCEFYNDEMNATLANSESFKSKIKTTGKTPNDGNTNNVQISVPLKYLNNFSRNLEMPLINIPLISY